ncbi:MAG: DUF362 domain-containing protein [Prochlorotrichaceae cyanobacterium]
MTFTITHNCIGCQRCLSASPTGAIATDGTAFWIETDRCNQCQGYGTAQCWAVCPTNEGCVASTIAVPLTSQSEISNDYWESWFAKHNRMVARLKSSDQPPYWRDWFETYSQTLKNLQTNLHHNDRSNIPATT